MLDIAFVIQSEPTYKCTCCGHIIGVRSIYNDYFPPEWEEWEFCPYCGAPLYDD